jgi:hypothetical protein
MDVKSYRGANIDSNHYLVIACQRARISSVKQVTGIKTRKYSVLKARSTGVAEQYRQQIEEKLNHITLTEQDYGEELWERCKTIINPLHAKLNPICHLLALLGAHHIFHVSGLRVNSIAEEVMDIMEPANRGMWFDDECQAATEDKNKAYRKMQQGYGTRSLTIQG